MKRADGGRRVRRRSMPFNAVVQRRSRGGKRCFCIRSRIRRTTYARERHTLARVARSAFRRGTRRRRRGVRGASRLRRRQTFFASRRKSHSVLRDEGGDTKHEKADSERHTLERLHAAVARLSTSRTFTTPEHLAAFASLRHSPCVPIQDAAKALFRANVEDVEDVDANAIASEKYDARCDLSHQVLESARAAVAAAEASLASEADAVRHLRAGGTRGVSSASRARRSPRKRSASPRPSWSPAGASTPRGRARKRLREDFREEVCVESRARWSRCSPRLTRCWSRRAPLAEASI